MCVSAWGRLKEPPSVWHSLWCNAIPTEPRQLPQSQAPYWARSRADFEDGSAMISGRDSASALVPSSARSDTMGLPF